MLKRKKELSTVLGLLRRHPVVGIVGARQIGKSTLARMVAERQKAKCVYFDLEDSSDLAKLTDPMLALRSRTGLVILDEIQRRPELFPALRVLADRPKTPCRFLVLGSAAPDLLRQSSETLAGRIAYHTLGGLALCETGADHVSPLWLRGGFPKAYLAEDDLASMEWRRGFIKTFLERDLAQLGFRVPSETMRRFWNMLAHYHGQTWNASDFSRSFGVADTTVRRYLDILTSAFLIRQLQPWFANISKRQVKAPKVYLTDSGLLHGLLNLTTADDVAGHPKSGASWEGFVIGQIIAHLGAEPNECFYWATHGGAELDLLIVRGRIRRGFEVKLTTAPVITPSMRSSLHDLGLDAIDVIHAGEETFPLSENIRAVAVARLTEDIEPIA